MITLAKEFTMNRPSWNVDRRLTDLCGSYLEDADRGCVRCFLEIGGMSLPIDVPAEVWIDGDGYLRRVAFTLDMEQLLVAMAGELGEEPPPSGAIGPQMRITMDYFGYGEDMGITVPAETVDLTDRPELFDYWALTQLADVL
jgi:hypothetical protein